MNTTIKNYSLFLLSIVFLFAACNSEEEYSRLELVSSVKINETEDLAIEIPRQADFISDTTMLLLATKTDIYLLNTITGYLSPFINIDSVKTQSLFEWIKNKYPNLTFKQDTLKENDFTLLVSNFQIVGDYLYLNIRAQFNVLGKLGDIEITVFKFFNIIEKYNLKTKKLSTQYTITKQKKTKYSIKSDTVDIMTELSKNNYSVINMEVNTTKGYISPSMGLYVDESKSKIYCHTIFDKELCFITELDLTNPLDDSNKTTVPIYYKKDKRRIKQHPVSSCSFYKLGEQLFCCDEKDIFMVYPEPKLYKEIVFDKFYSIKSFKILANDDILYKLKCDTSNYSVVNILKKDKIVNLLPDTNTRKLYLIQNGIHSIVLSGENYYFRTYKNI